MHALLSAAEERMEWGWATDQPAQRAPREGEAEYKDTEEGEEAVAGRCAHVAVVKVGFEDGGCGNLCNEHDGARNVEQLLAAKPASMVHDG